MLSAIFHPTLPREVAFVTVAPFTFAFEFRHCRNRGIDICSHGKMFDLEYAHDVVSLREDPIHPQASLDHLNHSIDMLVVSRHPSVQNWVGPKPNFVLTEEELGQMDRFGYFWWLYPISWSYAGKKYHIAYTSFVGVHQLDISVAPA